MSRIKAVNASVVYLKPKKQERYRALVRRLWRSLLRSWVAWDRRWQEEAHWMAVRERTRLREQARLHGRLPTTRWYGHD